MDEIAALALMGISAGVNSLRLMANRGLVSPKVVEEYAASITSHLSVADDDPKKAVFDQLSATVQVFGRAQVCTPVTYAHLVCSVLSALKTTCPHLSAN